MISRNAMYEQNKRDKGLKKVTLWIPEISADDLKLMASICCDNHQLIPSMVRDLKNAQLKEINNVN